MTLARLWLLALMGIVVAGLLLPGCGEKIAIPEPVGLYSGSPYRVIDTFTDPGAPVQLTIANNTLLVLTPTALTKRDQNYGVVAFSGEPVAVTDLTDARALCVNREETQVFVYDRGTSTVSWYRTSDLTLQGSSEVPEVIDGVSLATSAVGTADVPGIDIFLYVSDPGAGVVHRYAVDPVSGLYSYGILCRDNGDAARFVHEPAGLVQDSQDSLLVCDLDTTRNWVIRFDSTPQLDDVTADPDDQDPWRGRAALWGNFSGCLPRPAADYVLGNAAGCGESDWVGGTSTEQGEFYSPRALAIDGSGRIFVADTGNSRVQVFEPSGDYALLFGNPEETPAPVSLGLVDVVSDPANNRINYTAYVFVLLENGGQVLKFISNDQANDEGLPPPDLP
jgi:hypothetical protein